MTPYELVTKLMVVPGSIVAAVFPAFAATFASDRQLMLHLYDRSQRMVLLIVFPLALVATALAHEGLALWMGPMLPRESAVVMQWLAVGIFVNAIAHAPSAALQSAGRPDLVAKIHLAELPLYLGGLWFLVHRLGIVGVAIAWTLRVSVDTIALLYVARRTLGLQPGTRNPVHAFALMLVAVTVAAVFHQTTTRLLYVLVVGGAFAWLSRQYLIHESERTAMLAWLRSGRLFSRPEAA